MRRSTIWPAVVFAVCIAASAPSAEENFVSTIGAAPGLSVPGAGSATLTLNDTQTAITYYIQFSGLTSAQVAAHIHREPLGGTAFSLGAGTPVVGTWQFPSPEDVQRLRNSQLYILIHTQKHPTGELRGNILPQGVPVEPSTWGRIKALFQS